MKYSQISEKKDNRELVATFFDARNSTIVVFHDINGAIVFCILSRGSDKNAPLVDAKLKMEKYLRDIKFTGSFTTSVIWTSHKLVDSFVMEARDLQKLIKVEL